MYIHEAITARTNRKPYVARKIWGYVLERSSNRVVTYYAVRLNPTDTPDRCIVLSETSGTTCGWTPSAEDLLADDWIAVR